MTLSEKVLRAKQAIQYALTHDDEPLDARKAAGLDLAKYLHGQLEWAAQRETTERIERRRKEKDLLAARELYQKALQDLKGS